MSVAIIRHKVRDFAEWKAHYDGHEGRRAAGLGEGRILRMVDDPNEVVVILEFDDLDKFNAFARSPDLKETMQRAGVIDEPTVYVCN